MSDFSFNVQFGNVLGFFSLKTDLQFGYQLTDLACEISSKLPVIGNIASRSYLIQTDPRVKTCLRGLNSLNTQLKGPVSFFSQIQTLATTRMNTEATYIQGLNSTYSTLAQALRLALGSSGLLSDIGAVVHQDEVAKIEINLRSILKHSENLLLTFLDLSKDVTAIRNNLTSLTVLTPTHIRENLDEILRDEIVRSLQSIRNSVEFMTHTIKDTTRVALAQGSIYDTLNQYYNSDQTTTQNALNNFNNSHNRGLNNILSVAKTNNASAHNSFNNFILRTRQKYNDDIVRPAFEDQHLPEIYNFINLTVDFIYDVDRIESYYNTFRDTVLNSQANTSDVVFDDAVAIREKILDLQKTPYFVRVYSPCIDDLVSAAQLLTRSSSSKYVRCINERTSGVNLILPTIRSALNVFKDSVNLVLEQLNSCISYATTIEGRTETKDCMDYVSTLNFNFEDKLQYMIDFSYFSDRRQSSRHGRIHGK
jgi:hypothetical protein